MATSSRRTRLTDRLFTAMCTLAAAALVIVGLSRGNWKVAVFGALFFAGYGVLHSVARRLTPTARLVTGHEADDRERRAQFRATVVTGQTALATAAVATVLELTTGWTTGLWVAGTSLALVAVFVVALSILGRND